jgi:hypothetical protein
MIAVLESQVAQRATEKVVFPIGAVHGTACSGATRIELTARV